MSHDNFLDYGLGSFGSGGLQSCTSDLYGNCSQPLGPGFDVQIRSGNCTEITPFSKMQQHAVLSSFSPERIPRKNETINYVKQTWSGVL